MAHVDHDPQIPGEPVPTRSADGDAELSPWLLLWTILAVKVVTLAVIVVVARANGGALIAVTSIPWLFAAVALALGPVLFRIRLRRVRARRELLRRQEWMEENALHSADAAPPIERFT